MFAMLKKIGIIILPFVLLYVVCGFLYSGSPIENLGQRLLTLMESLGAENFWLSISEYWTNTVLPAWNNITSGSDVLTWITSLFTLFFVPVTFLMTIIKDLFGIIAVLFRFITFQPLV